MVVGAEDAAALELDVGRAGEPPGGLGHGFPLAAGVVGLGERLPDQGGALAERGPGLGGVLVQLGLLVLAAAGRGGGLVGVPGGLDLLNCSCLRAARSSSATCLGAQEVSAS